MCRDLYIDVTVNSLTWETSELQKTTYGLTNHVKFPLPPRESKPFLQNASLFAKQIFFFFFSCGAW